LTTVDLRRMRFLMNRLPMARFRVEKAMAKATKCTATLTGMPRGGSVGSQVESGMELLEAARGAYNALQDELEAMRNELAPYIPELDKPLERTAMHLRYIEGRSVREIAYQLAYSEQHMFRVLDQAEKKIAGM
jgi:hypothetical protein